MAWFEGSHTQTLTLPVPVARAVAHFSSLATIAANTDGLERHDIDGDVLHLLMKAQDHAGIAKFQGELRCRYVVEGDTVRWTTPAVGNMDQSGEARFSATADGCELRYTETVKIDMDVPSMMAPMLRPLISQVLIHEIKGFVGRMVKAA